MSLLTQQSEPTLSEKQAAKASQIRSAAVSNYGRLLSMQRDGIVAVWYDTQLTPQQVCDSLGTSAVKFFDLHAQLTEAVVDIAAIDGVVPEILLPTKAFTRNEDGTVTVLETPYVP